MDVEDGFVEDGALRELEGLPGILRAERNQIYRGATNDPDWPHQWGLKNTGQTFCGSGDGRTDISLEPAWASGARGAGVVVAVIDSGVIVGEGAFGPGHPDLGRFWRNSIEGAGASGRDDDRNGLIDDLWGWDFVEGDNRPQDQTGHGTSVAAILGAEADNQIAIVGVAPEATLMHVRFLDHQDLGDLADAVKAVEYAARSGASVINLSWTACEPDWPLELAIRGLPNVVFVAAAGNGKRSLRQCPEYPPAWSDDIPHLVSVMGVDCSRRRVHRSNWDADLAAPGSFVATFDHLGSRHFPTGTSMAAPQVSGVAALLLSDAPRMPAAEVVRRLKCSADDSATAALQVDHGIVDAEAALRGTC